MKTVKLELPSALLEAANFDADDVSRETARPLAHLSGATVQGAVLLDDHRARQLAKKKANRDG